MALWGLIIPLLIAFVVAVVVQVRGNLRGQRYWASCLRAGLIFGMIHFVYTGVLSLRLDALDVDVRIIVGVLIVAVLGGMAAFVLAMLVGLPLAIDRRREKRREP
ncbi:MAG: hypothetical protein WD294_13615 [Phycisphaeraceae bacterium]